MLFEQFVPGALAWTWIVPGCLEDIDDRLPRDFGDAQLAKLSQDAGVSPARFLSQFEY